MTASDGLLDLDEGADDRSESEETIDLGSRKLTPLIVLISVGLVFAVAQLLLFDEGRFLEWDEAVYASRASDRFSPIVWSAHRADGVPWIISPVLLLSPSLTLFRVWLVACSTVALGAAFAAWLRPIGFGAPLGMAFFCANWMTLFYGSEASPNLYVAACAVAVTGLLARDREAITLGTLGVLGAVGAAAVVLRPSDGFLIAAISVCSAFAIHSRRDGLRVTVTMAAGVAVGFLPWLVDSVANFGGPLERWRRASGLVESGIRWQVDDHLRLIDGPLIGPDSDPGFPVILALVFIAPMVLAWVGAFVLRERRVVLAATCSLFLALPYLLYIGALAPRFLLPALAVAAAGAGAYGADLLRRGLKPAAIIIAVLAVCAGASTIKAVHVERAQSDQRADIERVGGRIVSLADGASCHVLTQYGHPQVTISSGCSAARLEVSSAGCQVANSDLADDSLLVVAVVGEFPSDLAAAVAGPVIEGPQGWLIARVEPARSTCPTVSGG